MAKKKRFDSSGKGAAFERSVCQKLSLWVSNKTRDDVFWRSAMSGGRATLAARKGRGGRFSGSVGDIAAIDPLGHTLLADFTIECKAYKDLMLTSPLYDQTSVWEVIWDKPLAEAQAHNRQPLVIAKQNRKPELVITTYTGFEMLLAGQPAHIQPRAIFPRHACVVVGTLFEVMTEVNFDAYRTFHE